MAEKYNLKNPAVKRIMQEVKEMQSNPSEDYLSLPLEDNIFEWQFAIRGPQDTEFEGGIYHGRIQLPAEYPFKPPSFMLLTPNGRFETQTKICLSISQHHPEHWQPSWSVRTALVALIAFMPTKPDGAIGSLEYTKEERQVLAIKSRAAAPNFGTVERQKLIDEIHEYMLKRVEPLPGPLSITAATTSLNDQEASETAPVADGTLSLVDNAQPSEDGSFVENDTEQEIVNNIHEVNVKADAGPIAISFGAGFSFSTSATGNYQAGGVEASHQAEGVVSVNRAAPPTEITTEETHVARQQHIEYVTEQPPVARQPSYDDRGLTLLAIGLTIALVALLVKKFMKSYWWFDASSI